MIVRPRPAHLALLLAGALVGASASAAPPSPRAATPVDVVVEAFPVIASGSAVSQGWSEIAVRIQNNGGKPSRGQVEVKSQAIGRGAGEHGFRATAPYSVGVGAAVNVRVPALVGAYGDLAIEVRDEQGSLVQAQRVDTFHPSGLTLLEVSETSRLRAAIADAVIVPLTSPSLGRSSAATLSVATPRFDPATGDPILPDRAALYSGADAVLVRSDTLSRLGGAELDALAGYVLAGGTLAVAVARPEDLRHPTLIAFAGGAIHKQGVSAATLADFSPPATTGTLSPSAKLITPTPQPAGDLVESLAGHAGGNLRGSLYGSSAAYGLGEVHLLAFDPTQKPAVDDPWAQARVIDLTRRAFDRRSTTSVLRRDGAAPHSFTRIRQQLDPNESSRWAIGAAALLLCVYALIAGPINFSLATKAGMPLRALRWLPIISIIAFVMVVGIGVAAKGVSGRARHLTLVEAGAGMGKGAASRFRGFYASRARELTVRTTDASSVVATAVLPEYADQRDHLIVDREGARLVEVAALPWQTVVVREQGFASLGDGIALVKDGASGVAVINRSGRDMRAAVLRTPGGASHYFARIKDGERVATAAANAVGATVDGGIWEAQMLSARRLGSIDLHRLAAHALRGVMEGDAPGLSDAWWALEDAASDTADWFPDRVPTLIGQLDGGEGRLGDAGLRLETDRVLVRIVGFGGRP